MAEIQETKEDNFIEVEEPQQVIKIKKPISEEKRRQLDEARKKGHEKKRELKELHAKSKQLHIEEAKVKAIQYDQIIKQKEELLKPREIVNKVQEPEVKEVKEVKEKKKRVIKKIIYEDDSEEEIEDKRFIQKQSSHGYCGQIRETPSHYNHFAQSNDSYTNLVYQSACDKLKEKVQDERTKFLINSLMPNNYR